MNHNFPIPFPFQQKGGADGLEQPDDEPADDVDPEPAGVLPAAGPPLRPPHARHRLPGTLEPKLREAQKRTFSTGRFWSTLMSCSPDFTATQAE